MSSAGSDAAAERTPRLATVSTSADRSASRVAMSHRRTSPSDSEPTRWPCESMTNRIRALFAVIFVSAESTDSLPLMTNGPI